MWFKFLIALWERTGAQSGTVSAILDNIGNVRGGMLARFENEWLEFVASAPNSIPLLGPNVDVNLVTPTGLLDLFGNTVGSILYRGQNGWTVLTPIASRFLMSQGPGQPPVLTTLPTQPPTPATTTLALTATGTNQATALALTQDWSVVSTVAAGTGVIMRSVQAGFELRIWNDGANALNIYPPLGAAIDALGTNNPYVLPINRSQIISKLTAVQWRTQFLG